MPAKKTQNKESNKKKSSNICNFHNRGYCKKKDACENIHSDKVCEDINCNEETCQLRHPNPCKFGIRCKFQKKNECMYMHVTFAPDVKKIEALNLKFTSQFGKLESSLKMMQKYVEERELIISNLNKANEEKDAKIVILANKLEELENKIATTKNIEEIEAKLQNLETAVKNQQKNNKQVYKSVDNLENIIEDIDKSRLKCSKCDFKTTSAKGLKTHIARIHTASINENDNYPMKCDLCEIRIKSKCDMRKHLKTHSYKAINYQCQECGKFCENEFEMEVHIGREHLEQYECGICGFETKDIENLNLHLTTCERYKCDHCAEKFATLTELKNHLKTEQIRDVDTNIFHIKQNRTNSDAIDKKSYLLGELFADL